MNKPVRTLGELVDSARERADRFDTTIELGIAAGDAAVEVSGIVDNSINVEEGMVFCAVRGDTRDGHDYVDNAVGQGARAVLVERDVSSGVPELRTDDVRKTMPWVASAYWGHPSDAVATIGVTGTNGKTTITTILSQLADQDGRGGMAIGTLDGELTTPQAPELQRKLAQAVANGQGVVAVEVSSHALEQHRADAIDFAVGVFTNLSTDHLDYHETMDHYFAAKAKLFDGRARSHVIVVDDGWGERLAQRVPGAVIVRPDDIVIESRRADRSVFRWRGHRIALPLVGDFNVVNAVCAAEAASLVGIAESVVVDGLQSMKPVRGRMDPVVGLPPGSPVVYVDYSHTPDGLEQALDALRKVTTGRLICVFGAGGDRDPTKRPMMGSAAEHGSDITIVTSDNPRSEDPNVIIEQVLSGMDSPCAPQIHKEPDRRAAISYALSEANGDDVVLVAGRGHEKCQKLKDETVDFDDAVVVSEQANKLAEERKGEE